jgi:ribosomal protein L22
VSPSKPGTPSEGKPDDEKIAQDAADAKAEATPEETPKPKKKPAAKKKAEPKAAEAEGTAAETTKVDKKGAEAAAVAEPEKPKRSRKPAAKKDEEAAKPAAAPARRGKRQPGELVIVRAQAKYVRSSPRKARLVCDHIRGKTVVQARSILAFHPRAVSEAWSKLLESAIANAENNHELNGEDLKIHAVYADAGPTIKRYRPRAMGRATRIRKRTSHLTIQLTPITAPTTSKRGK